jgi:hypothetical protein
MMRGMRSKRDQALGARAAFVLVAVDRKGDAHAAEDHLRLAAPRLHAFSRLTLQPFVVDAVLLAHALAAVEHLVKGRLHDVCLLLLLSVVAVRLP